MFLPQRGKPPSARGRAWVRCGLNDKRRDHLPAARLFRSSPEMTVRPEPRTRSREAKFRRGRGSASCLVEQGYGVCGADERPHAGQQQQLVDQLGHDVLPRSGSGIPRRHADRRVFIAPMRATSGSPELQFEGTQGTAPIARNAPARLALLRRLVWRNSCLGTSSNSRRLRRLRLQLSKLASPQTSRNLLAAPQVGLASEIATCATQACDRDRRARTVIISIIPGSPRLRSDRTVWIHVGLPRVVGAVIVRGRRRRRSRHARPRELT
jgi:hypothetical protein